MRHHPVIAGAALAWAVPAVRGELAGNVNQRIRADFTHATRVRLAIAGGVVGLSTCTLGGDYSLDGVAWVDLGLIVHTLILGGGNPTQVSAYVDLPVEARDLVWLRVMGVGGDGVAAPTFSYLQFESDGEPVYPANSLANCRKGRDWVFFGGSQIGGGGVPGDFGTVDPAIAAALDPLFLLGHGAGGITYRKNGATLTAVPTEHGAEIGFLYALWLAGGGNSSLLAGSRVVCRYVVGTDAANWVTTNFATVITDVAHASVAGMTPCCAFYVLGSTDAQNDTDVASLDNQLRQLQTMIDAAFDQCGWVVQGQVTTDGATFPRLVESRAVGERRFEDAINGRRAYILPDPVFALLQPDDQHPTSAGHVVQGQDMAVPILADGVVV